ncbi:MAG: DnaJ domain-containing protein [Spirochaetes bacterium]|nr:DnaJ domain-containing protein [Spirochaetota bacterium]
MNSRDHYAVLGVAQEANGDEIKRAFRRLAMQYHPDRNPGDREAEQRFKEIADSYAVLADPEKKRIYDVSLSGAPMFGAGLFRGTGMQGGGGCGRGRGCRGGRGRFGRWAALAASCDMELTVEEARRGARKTAVAEGPTGRFSISVEVPPGTGDGTVFRTEASPEMFPLRIVDIHIRIV